MKILKILLFCALMIAACEKSTDPEPPAPENPIYITVAGHIEDTSIYASCDAYPDYRRRLLAFAETIAPCSIAFNLQIDYEFFAGTSRCETPEMRQETGGLTVIDYLATEYGFEIDPHQEGGWEEGQDNYADVHFMGGTLTTHMSDVVGGLVWDDPAQFTRLAEGEAGWLNPAYIWHPEILTLAVSHDHHLGDFSRDDVASGVWRSKGAHANFWVHDPDQAVITIGPGEHTDWGRTDEHLSSVEFIEMLATGMADGAIPSDRIYTVTLAVPQSIIFHAEEHQNLLDKLDAIAPYIESGQAKYATYSEVAEIWQTEYDSQPNIYFRTGITRPQDKQLHFGL